MVLIIIFIAAALIIPLPWIYLHLQKKFLQSSQNLMTSLIKSEQQYESIYLS